MLKWHSTFTIKELFINQNGCLLDAEWAKGYADHRQRVSRHRIGLRREC